MDTLTVTLTRKQMYKKRVNTRGFKKHIKSNEKDKAITKIINDELIAASVDPIRLDKLVRHARCCAKRGALESHNLNKIVKREYGRSHRLSAMEIERAITTQKSLLSFNQAFVAHSPALPDRFASFELFLRVMQWVIEKERGE